MLKEYDFSNAIKGKYVKSYEEGTNVVVIDQDVANFFQIMIQLIKLLGQ